jgi:putative ABC transport system permease protein
VTWRVAEPTRLRSGDVLGEAVASIGAAPQRSVLTAAGTLLAVASLVAVLGIASSAAGQIASVFNQQLPTHVRVTTATASRSATADPFPADVEQRLRALNGVLAAGVYWRVPVRSPLTASARPPLASPGVLAASPGFLRAAGAAVSQGRLFGAGDQARAAPVCLLGARAARALGISSVVNQATVLINALPCTVIGVISHVRSQLWILRSVLMPTASATTIWGSSGDTVGAEPGVLIQTRPGAAALIARQAPLAISADAPRSLLVTVQPTPVRLRGQVNVVLDRLYAMLALIGLVIGAAGIAGETLIALRERTAEVGLRRALGARRRHIAAQFLTESALLGLLGGLGGTTVGVAAVVFAALAQGWTPVIAPLTVLPAPVIGAAVGLLAGLYPSWRASRIEPARALSDFRAT